ncbi:MAG: outer membrane beta-barrel protein [Pseudomonadota bacterium]
MFGYKTAILLGGTLVASTYSTAVAQESWFQRDRNIAVTERSQPQFDPEPLRLGAFQARSSLGLGGYYIDNVFATAENTVDDFAFTIRPEVDVRSDWSRHEVGVSGSVEHFEFVDQGSESQTNLRAGVRGRLDVTRDFSLSARGFVEDLFEPRTQISILDEFGEPVQFTRFGGALEGRYQRDRIQATVGYEVTDTNFDDVEGIAPFGDIDQDFRDGLDHTVRGRVAYAVTRDWAVFTQGSYFVRNFDEPTLLGDGTLASRDSDGFTIEGGVNFELQGPFRGDVAVGYIEDNREDPAFADITGVSVDGRLQWFPTRLTTVTATAGRRTTDVGLVGAAAAIATNGGVRVDHELLRNVLLFAEANVFDTQFEDFDRDDTFFDIGVGSVYKLNKRVHLEGFYRYTNRDSSIPLEEFNQNIVGFELRFYP